ncbi:MAG: RNA polymerase sigma factor [Bacteroidales bacterium]|nr:RNA polymerase sigma factor [Bacteroidales bacterium]
MKTSVLPDDKLIEAYLSGNEAAVVELINRHKRKVYSYIYIRTGNKELACDILQEVFVKAFYSIKQKKYTEIGKFDCWLIRIAHNLIIDYIRQNSKLKLTPIETDQYALTETLFLKSSETSDKKILRNEDIRDIRELLNKLPANQKEIIIMRHFLGMSFKEIAERTNVSINTALGRMRYALINLKKLIAQYKIELINID